MRTMSTMKVKTKKLVCRNEWKEMNNINLITERKAMKISKLEF